MKAADVSLTYIDRPMLGISLMCGFCFFAPLGDAIAKLLGETIPILQLLAVRFGAQVILLTPIVVLWRLHWRYRPKIMWLIALRTVFHILGMGAMFASLRFLPLADAIAIAFVMPFIMLLLGKYFLGEEVGQRRLIACCVGFIGTLLVVQPSFAAVGLPALLPICVALAFALFMLITRQIAKECDAVSLQAVSGGMALVMLSPLLIIGIQSDIEVLKFVNPTTTEMWLLLFSGVLGSAAHLLMTWSLRFAPSTTLAPMQYLEIPFATVIGFWIFGDWPNGLAAVGILITIGSGLYVILREQATQRAAAKAV